MLIKNIAVILSEATRVQAIKLQIVVHINRTGEHFIMLKNVFP